jgi:ribosomal protein S18 acetylase RimI-like enzyme
VLAQGAEYAGGDSMPNSSIEVREAVLTDAPEVVRLFRLLGHELPETHTEARLAAFLESGERVLVATRAGSATLLGAASLHITPVIHRPSPVGRFTAVVVDEGARGQGIGSALIEAAEKFLAERGCVQIEVTSNKKRTRAHEFYERLGYTGTSFRFAKAIRRDNGESK